MTLPPAAYTFNAPPPSAHPHTNPFNMHNPNPVASGSSFKTKRKRMSWAEDEGNKQMRIRSPPLEHRSTFPLPELTMDHSAPTSDDDQAMDTDTDMDADADAEMNMAMGLSGRQQLQQQQENYTYSTSGSGGFGFGPGAEEDEFEEVDMVDDMGAGAMKTHYGVHNLPSLTPHPNPNHFSNANTHAFGLSSNTTYTSNNPNFRATSPIAAQPFTTSLHAPLKPAGLLQPTFAAPLGANATEVERARAGHGPHCSSIPKLVMSEHPDASGKRSLWSVCGDCGACEMAQ